MQYQMQADLLENVQHNQNEFWKTIGKVGIGCKKNIPMEVITENGSVSNNVEDVLSKWESCFSKLYTSTVTTNTNNHGLSRDNIENSNDHIFDEPISVFEVQQAVKEAKLNKASGIDDIPAEVLKNETAISSLHILYNVVFTEGTIPTEWGKGVINPIPKSSTTDPRDPLQYRGIILASCMYKIYCSIINKRLSNWIESNDKLVDEQNGFRKGRSTYDQISALTNIIETRQKRKLSTFAAFIDLKKAYDLVDRNILWNRLLETGIKGKLFSAIRSLYNSVISCVRINGLKTGWFDVNIGLRQGCNLSPILFNLFINDFAVSVKALGKGIDVGNEKVCILVLTTSSFLLIMRLTFS